MSDCCLTPTQQFFSYIMARTSWFLTKWWWGPLCTRPTRLVGFYSTSSLKQKSADRHVAPLGHIILIPCQSVFALSPYCCVLSGNATNTNFIVFDLTRSLNEKPKQLLPKYFMKTIFQNIFELMSTKKRSLLRKWCIFIKHTNKVFCIPRLPTVVP